MTASLFDRLGKSPGIREIVLTIVERHLANPVIRKRFEPLAADADRLEQVTQHLCDFLEAGSGGPGGYTGRSMVDAHHGMNISGEEYLAAMDDIMDALAQHDIDEATRKDVLFITYSLKPEIAHL